MPEIETPNIFVTAQQENRANNPSALSVPLLIVCGIVIPVLLAYGFAVGNELQILAIILGILGVGLIAARPFTGLILFVALLYTRPEDSIHVLAGMHFTLIIAVVTLISMFVKMLLDREVVARNPAVPLYIGFAIMAVISALPLGTVSDTAQDVAKLVALILLVVNLTRTPERFRALVTAVLLFTSYAASYSIFLYFNGGGLNDQSVLRSQSVGLFENPNDLADVLVVGLALSISRLFSSSWLQRAGYGVLVALSITAIMLTQSRGGMLAMLIVSFVCILSYFRSKWMAVIVAIVVVGALFLGASGRMTNFNNEEESANSRFHYWTNAIDHFVSSPLIGVGYANFHGVNGGAEAHNSFVTVFVETGFPGYFFWMGALFYAFRPRPKEHPAPDIPPALMSDITGIKIALFGYLVGSFWSNHPYNMILFLIVGVACVGNIASHPGFLPLQISRKTLVKDAGWIALIAACSIVIINLIALKNG